MSRKKTISVDTILDAAEATVMETGAHRLTLAAVAEKAGISKGGLAYSFETKEALIKAMTERELARFSQEVEKAAAQMKNATHPQLLARIAVTRGEDEIMISKAAGMLASLLQLDGERTSLQETYREDLAQLGEGSVENRRARLAFWALEGMFLLRGLGFLDIPEKEWKQGLDDIRDAYLGKF